jgi:SAM-dependent methyltransferase
MTETGPDARLSAPSALRNRDPILAVLQGVLPAAGTVLEIASGTGQHSAYFAPHFPALAWQPTERDAASLPSIAAWAAASGAANIRPPRVLDVAEPDWGVDGVTAILCLNMIHIAPWSAAEALLAGAGRVLTTGGLLYLYGPFKRGGRHTAPSNAAFDADLRRRDPAWGVRDLDDVARAAAAHGLALAEIVEMPANNLSVVFRRR